MPRVLEAELRSEFFVRLGLEAVAKPVAAADGRCWHVLRPAAPTLHEEAELGLMVDASGGIVEASLGLMRRFIDVRRSAPGGTPFSLGRIVRELPNVVAGRLHHSVDPARDTPTARDIATSFLGWLFREPPWVLADMIVNIAVEPGAAPPPALPLDGSGGSRVFRGASDWIGFEAGAGRVFLTNETRCSTSPMTPPLLGLSKKSEENASTSRPDGPRWLRIDVELDAGSEAARKQATFKIMRSPAQCVLWREPERLRTNSFEHLETIEHDSHFERDIYACRECGQKYLWEMYEIVDWDEGHDRIYETIVPIATEAEIAWMETATIWDLMGCYPRLHADDPPAWRRLDDD